MKSRKLIYQIFPANILVTVGALLAVIWYGSSTLKAFYIDETEKSLSDRAYAIEDLFTTFLVQGDINKLEELTRKIGRKSSTRITCILPSGKVVADSAKNATQMDNHTNRPEIRKALTQQEVGSSVRFSRTIGERMLYVAIPLYDINTASKKKIIGVLRLSISVARMEATLSKVKKEVAMGILLVICIAAALTIYVSHRITNPLEEMTKGAERFAVGRFSPRLMPPAHVSSEIYTLSQALNSMAAQLQERISTILRQRNELQTFLDSMLAGVITVDLDEKMISINDAASMLLDIQMEKSIGRPIQDSIRNFDILGVIQKTLTDGETIEEEMTYDKNGTQHLLLINSIPLYDEEKTRFGALLVLNDITKIRRLENIRSDFVANVSHELKTPITTIKGYVETILDDSLEDRENAIRFLETVLKKANHLNAIIDDLLMLSRMEQQKEANAIRLSDKRLKPVLEEVIHTCWLKTEEKNITLKLKCSEALILKMNDVLLEQAITNLVINSIMYSPEKSTILIRAKKKTIDGAERLVITVKDSGVGISDEHLPRLFERFYRSDKARSRKLGGTGLGLAIVKHITQAHNGKVDIESKEGKGTSVHLILPLPSPKLENL